VAVDRAGYDAPHTSDGHSGGHLGGCCEQLDIATSFTSGEEAVGAIFDEKKDKRVDDAPAEGSKSKEPTKKQKRDKKGKKPHRDTRAQGHDENDDEALAVNPASRALEGPLEAPACSMTW
jgi:hypothetical protein